MEKKLKKIMFNDKYGLTKAVLEGRKTQTRRLLKHQPSCEDSEMLFYIFDDERYYDKPEKDPLWGSVSWKNPDGTKTEINKVAYLIGEEVAIAQSYFDCGYTTNARRVEIIPGHFAQFGDGSAGWNNKMFVRSDLMPHRIRIKDVNLQRLQNISDDDCMKEGLEFAKGGFYVNFDKNTNSRIWLGKTCREAFAALIDKTCGKGTWQSNPYVFVYDFELIR